MSVKQQPRFQLDILRVKLEEQCFYQLRLVLGQQGAKWTEYEVKIGSPQSGKEKKELRSRRQLNGGRHATLFPVNSALSPPRPHQFMALDT